MYSSMGDIPLILQGANQREAAGLANKPGAALTPENTIVPIVVGIITTFLLRGSQRRSLWALLLLIPSLLHAQTVTPFVQKMPSGTDTLIVYGRSLTTAVTTTNTTTTVDSIVKWTPPIVLGKPFGPSGFFATNVPPLPFYAPFTAGGGENSIPASQLVANLAKARLTKYPIVVALPCGAHNQDPTRRGLCLRDSSGVAVFSRARYDSALATYNTPAVAAAVDSALKAGVLLGINLMDEPWVKGNGDGNTWGPKGLTRQQADTSCRAARNLPAFAGVPVGLSDASPNVWATSGYIFQWCDFGVPQFSYRFGSPAVWRDTMLTQVAQGRYGELFSFNIVNGGTQDKTTWPACPGAPSKGTSSPNCTMSGSQAITAASALGDAGCGALIMWRTDSARYAAIGQPSFTQIAATQAQRQKRPCKVRP